MTKTVRGDLKHIGDVLPIQLPNQRYIDKAVEIFDESALEVGSLGFLGRVFVQVGLPHSNPGTQDMVWERRNGNLSFQIQPGFYKTKTGKTRCIGYPYGKIPRLILAYLQTQALLRKSPQIPLGKSLGDFIRALDPEMPISGGPRGTCRAVKDQILRLFTCHMSFIAEDFGENRKGVAIQNEKLIRKMALDWDSEPNVLSLFGSEVTLSQDFFDELMKHPVPVDLRSLRALSPLGCDLYTGFTHRVFSLKRPQPISWQSLALQTGAEYTNLKDFAKKAKREIQKIQVFWPDLKVDFVRGRIWLKPSKPHIPEKTVAVLASI